MAIEILGDILEELADKLGVNGAEERNAWIIEMNSRIIVAIETERAVQRNYGKNIDKMRECRLDRADTVQ